MFTSHLAVQIWGSQTLWEGKKITPHSLNLSVMWKSGPKKEFLSQWRWSSATNRFPKIHTELFFILLPTPVQFENHLCRPQC